jgi:hypothetical protein
MSEAGFGIPAAVMLCGVHPPPQHAHTGQVMPWNFCYATQDAQSAAAAAQAMRQALEAEVASYQENNTQLKQVSATHSSSRLQAAGVGALLRYRRKLPGTASSKGPQRRFVPLTL